MKNSRSSRALRKIKSRCLDDFWSETRHRDDLDWLDYDADELIRLHRKLKARRDLTRAEKGFLADVVYFALGASIRGSDILGGIRPGRGAGLRDVQRARSDPDRRIPTS